MSDASIPKLILPEKDATAFKAVDDRAMPNIGRNRTLALFVGALTVVSLVVLGWTGFELWRGFSPTRPPDLQTRP